MPRLLFIDDDFNPTVRSGAEGTLRGFINDFKSAGYDIGPSDFAGFTNCPDKTLGISVCNPLLKNTSHFIPPSLNQRSSKDGSMFFAVDAAFKYFEEFVKDDNRWNEIDAVIIDIMMPPGTLLSAKYRRSRVDENNAGVYLKRYLKELVAEYRIPQNPDIVLPVMVLTNKSLIDDQGRPLKVNQNGRQPDPQPGSPDRLLVWNIEKTYARNNLGALVKILDRMVARRVR